MDFQTIFRFKNVTRLCRLLSTLLHLAPLTQHLWSPSFLRQVLIHDMGGS